MTKTQEDNNDKRHTNAVDTAVHSPFHASIDSVQKKWRTHTTKEPYVGS